MVGLEDREVGQVRNNHSRVGEQRGWTGKDNQGRIGGQRGWTGKGQSGSGWGRGEDGQVKDTQGRAGGKRLDR